MITSENKAGKLNSIVKIKKSRSLLPLMAIFTMFLSALSVYCLLLPFAKNIVKPLDIAFYIVGGLGSLYFITYFFIFVSRMINPKNALLVSEEGFLDLINGETGAGKVLWNNVSLLEIRGNDRPYIAIGVINYEPILKKGSKQLKEQILRRNEKGLPVLMIRPFEIACSLDEAFDALTSFRNIYLKSISNGDTSVISDLPDKKAVKKPELANIDIAFEDLEEQLEKQPQTNTRSRYETSESIHIGVQPADKEEVMSDDNIGNKNVLGTETKTDELEIKQEEFYSSALSKGNSQDIDSLLEELSILLSEDKTRPEEKDAAQDAIDDLIEYMGKKDKK